MKKINSNSYAGRWIAAGLAPIVLAGILEFAREMWGAMIPDAVIRILQVTGAILLSGFALLLAIELAQDRWLNAYYQSRRRAKVPLGTGYYECQACGYQRVGKEDAICHACGIAFQNDEMRA